jgi:lysophospholipase L1-like esterase
MFPALFLGLFFCALVPQIAGAQTKPSCKVPEQVTRLERALPRTAQRLLMHGSLKVVAIGSSSTAGAGASAPSESYPSRLAVELAAAYPAAAITIINRGVNGQDASDMVQRLKDDVLAEQPDLVLWQLGTNAALRGTPLNEIGERLEAGIALIKDAHVDLVLIDPQFAPKVIAKPEADDMVALIAAVAHKRNVGVFHRYAISRYWRNVRELPFDTFVTPDGLHMNDWGYGCWAKLLSASIVEAVSRPTESARVMPGSARAPEHSLGQ